MPSFHTRSSLLRTGLRDQTAKESSPNVRQHHQLPGSAQARSISSTAVSCAESWPETKVAGGASTAEDSESTTWGVGSSWSWSRAPTVATTEGGVARDAEAVADDSEDLSELESSHETEQWDWSASPVHLRDSSVPAAPPGHSVAPANADTLSEGFSGWDFDSQTEGQQSAARVPSASTDSEGEARGWRVSWPEGESSAESSLAWVEDGGADAAAEPSESELPASWLDRPTTSLPTPPRRRRPIRRPAASADHEDTLQDEEEWGTAPAEPQQPEAANAGWWSEAHHAEERRVPSWNDLADLFEGAGTERLQQLERQEAGAEATEAQLRVPVVDRSLSGPSEEQMRREIDLEQEAIRSSIEDAKSVQESVVGLERGMELGPMRALEQDWLTAIVEVVDREQAALLQTGTDPGKRAASKAARGASGGGWSVEDAVTSAQSSSPSSSVGQTVGPYMLLLPPEKLSVIALHTTLNLLLAKGGTAPATSVMSRIGTMVEAEVNVSRLEGRDRRAWERMQGTMDSKKLVSLRQRCKAALDDAEWPVAVKAKLGAALLKCVVDTATVRIPASDVDRARIEWFAANTVGSTRPFVNFAGLAGHVRLSNALEHTLESLTPAERQRLGEADPAEESGTAEAEAGTETGQSEFPLSHLVAQDRQRIERVAVEGSRDDSTMFPGMLTNHPHPGAQPTPISSGADEAVQAGESVSVEPGEELSPGEVSCDESGAAGMTGTGWGLAAEEARVEDSSVDALLDPASTSESDAEEGSAVPGTPSGAGEAEEPTSLRLDALRADSGPDHSTVSTRLPKALEDAASRGVSADEVALPAEWEAEGEAARMPALPSRHRRSGGVSQGALAHALRFDRFDGDGARSHKQPASEGDEQEGYSADWMSKMFPLPSSSELRVMDALRYPGKYLADGGMMLMEHEGEEPAVDKQDVQEHVLQQLHQDEEESDASEGEEVDASEGEEVDASEGEEGDASEGEEGDASEGEEVDASDGDQHHAVAPPGSRVEMPALVHSYAWAPKRGSAASASGVKAAVGVIRLHPHVLGMLREAGPSPNKQLFYPMIVPPKPWKKTDGGGYVVQRARLMRTKGSRMQTRVLKDATMPGMYEALNVLGGVAWRMNGEVRDVVKQVWESGGGIGDIPSRSDHAPPLPPDLDAIEDPDERKAQYRSWRRMNARVEQWNRDLHGLRCDHLLKMEVADKFRDDVVYFPHNLDFRGRVYPVPPHLNHMGADICRGLLLFAEKRPLGEAGLRWLKIHLANKMGMDKIAFPEREAFIDDAMHEVFDSADRPLTGNGWWLGADSPWQALATCQDLAAAMRSSNPLEHMSSVPVHQDGTCNGLQHYAALGRDYDGAAAVNLVAADKPQDVYSAVLALVMERIEKDAALPEEPVPGTPADELAEYESKRRCAAFVRGTVVRKTIKQTVMTSVYGVTFIGARDQIRNRLRETFEPRREELGLSPDELDDLLFKCAAYLARTTLDSLGQMFEAADSIKSWLTQAARLVATTNQPMSWITPLGLPVVQPYRRNASQVVSTVMQQVVLASENDALPVSSQKQGSAFPPNYVHSLDSTHMMMTAIASARRGMVFTAVHDSYWTHACDVDEMNVLLRDAFVNLYEMPLLEELRASLVLRFPALSFPELPKRGTLDLELVRSSPYFFN